MKILELDLAAFGPFANQSLDFREGSFGLHLIYGPNEAGKSATLRALRQVLYGIERQTPDNFRIPYNQLKLGATLEDHEGRQLSFTRLKKDKNPLRTAGNEILSDDCLDGFLGHVDETRFKHEFGLNWEMLKKGGEEMIRSDGEMARILFAAGSGLSALSEVQTAIEQEMGALFLPKGSNPKINALVEQYKTVQEQLRAARVSSDEWRQHAEALEDAEKLKRQLIKQKKELEREKSRLERIQNAKHPIKKYREIQTELESLKGAAILEPGFSERRLQVRDEYREALQTKSSLEEQLKHLAEQTEAITFNQALIEQAAEIESLYQDIGAYKNSVRDCPSAESRRQTAENEALRLLKELRPGASLEEADDLSLSVADRTLVGELGPDQKALEQRVRSAQRDLAEARRELEELKQKRETHPKVPELSDLKSAHQGAVERGQLESDREEKQRALKQAEEQAALDCRRLPFWSGTLEELEKITVPLRETLNQFQTRFDEADKQLQERQSEKERDGIALREIKEAFDTLEEEGEVPTEADLAAARDRRDAGWELIVRTWRDGEDCAGRAEVRRSIPSRRFGGGVFASGRKSR